MSLRHRSLVVIVAGMLTGAGTASAWTTHVPDTPQDSTAFALAADAAGDVVAVGRAVNALGGDDGIAVKLGSADGALLWQVTISGTVPVGGGSEDDPTEIMRAVATAPNGDAIVAGRVVNDGTDADLLVTRLGGTDGTAGWTVPVDGGAALGDDGQAVAVDGAGDVLVTGALTEAGTTFARTAVLKLAGGDGTEQWRALLDGDAGIGRAIGVDASNDVLVAGDVAESIVVTRRASADGGEVWRTDLVGAPGNATGRGLAVVSDGGVVVAGRLFDVTRGPDFTVVALDASGVERWRRQLDGTAVGTDDADEAFAVTIDADGDVVAAGRLSNTGTNDDLVVAKLAGDTGIELWRAEIDGGNSRADEARAVVVDLAGHVVVTGSIRNQGSGRDFIVASLDGATGAERWRHVIDGTSGQADVAFALVRDALGDVVASGRMRNTGSTGSFTVLKRAADTGGDFPCGNGVEDGEEACDDGNLALGDGCRPDCTVEVCGDGIQDPAEGCDDGNVLDGDCCSPACTVDADALPCEDGSLCTTGDVCAGAVCVPGTATVCTPVNDCQESACDPATGLCVDRAKPNGRACSDDDACTIPDVCDDGFCQSGSVLTCDDYEPCTADSCDAASGCVHAPYESYGSVSCAFDHVRIATFCFEGLPRVLQKLVDRSEAAVEKASGAAKVKKSRTQLKRARSLAEKARRKIGRQDLNAACKTALDSVLNQVSTRAATLRDALRPE
jgi:cysteine-rich repeat protein